MPEIVTLTLNPAVDKSCEIDQVVPERKLRCGEPSYHPGGGGINVARAIHILGGDSTAYWPCGGAMGELFRQLLDCEDIDHRPIPVRAMTRENFIVFERSSQQQFRFGMPGATLTEEEIQLCIDRLKHHTPQPDYLVLSGSLPPGVPDNLYGRVASEMPGECRVILDTSGRPLQLGLESSAYLIKPNVHELEQLAGHEIRDDRELREVAGSLIERGKANVVVTSLGSGGAAVTTATEHTHMRAPTVKIRSKVGAGDSMVAGMVFALAQGKTVVEAARFGVAAGAAAVMTAGTELCRQEDVLRLYQEMTDTAA